MSETQRRAGRPRKKKTRAPRRIFVGGYVDEHVADDFDDICYALDKSRAQVVRELVLDFMQHHEQANSPQSTDQEALIAS